MSTRTVVEARKIGELIVSVCDEAYDLSKSIEKLKLKAAYYKALHSGKDVLAKILKDDIDCMERNEEWDSIDDLYSLSRITIMDHAFCVDL